MISARTQYSRQNPHPHTRVTPNATPPPLGDQHMRSRLPWVPCAGLNMVQQRLPRTKPFKRTDCTPTAAKDWFDPPTIRSRVQTETLDNLAHSTRPHENTKPKEAKRQTNLTLQLIGRRCFTLTRSALQQGRIGLRVHLHTRLLRDNQPTTTQSDRPPCSAKSKCAQQYD